ncbi:MAG: ATP-binding protein [Coprothermobacterota bacterium]|nr:ATP-binding protein [Coprothermobacterota bacterium]
MSAITRNSAKPPPVSCECGCGEALYPVRFWMPEGGAWRYPTLCSLQEEEYKRQKRAETLRWNIEWIDEMFPRRSMGPRQLEATLDNYEPFEGILAGLKAARSYLDHWEENEKRGHGLIFQGEVGLGKTHLISAIVNELNRRLIFSYFLSVPLFLERVRDSFDEVNASEGKVMRSLAAPKLLALNDMGAEKSSQWAIERLYQLIDDRCNYRSPVLVATNLDARGLASVYGARIMDRLYEMCGAPIRLEGDSYRKRRK